MHHMIVMHMIIMTDGQTDRWTSIMAIVRRLILRNASHAKNDVKWYMYA